VSITHFEYYGIGSSSPSYIRMSLTELAVNIVTDWMPGVPPEMARGFTDLLDRTLKPEVGSSPKLWAVEPFVDSFENQWKQVTSWILGVAFCRKIIEMEGYPWWAPVSAFKNPGRSKKTSTHYWQTKLSVNDCEVRRPNAHMLFPDYILAKTTGAGSYDVSFAESKATDAGLKKRATPPSDWRAQSQNANFYFKKKKQLVTQRLLVATRVNPKAVRPQNRRVIVRAWNSREPDNQVTQDTFRNLLQLHYLGICVQLRLAENARQLGLTNDAEEGRVRRQGPLPGDADAVQRDAFRELSVAEFKSETIERLGGARVFFPERTPEFTVGDRRIRVGLTESALDVMQWLQGTMNVDGDRIIAGLAREAGHLHELAGTGADVVVRGDGVVGQLVRVG
jgi:hypothetical protein